MCCSLSLQCFTKHKSCVEKLYKIENLPDSRIPWPYRQCPYLFPLLPPSPSHPHNPHHPHNPRPLLPCPRTHGWLGEGEGGRGSAYSCFYRRVGMAAVEKRTAKARRRLQAFYQMSIKQDWEWDFKPRVGRRLGWECWCAGEGLK